MDSYKYSKDEFGVWEIFHNSVASENHLVTVEGTYRSAMEYAPTLVENMASAIPIVVKIAGNVVDYRKICALRKAEQELIDNLIDVKSQLQIIQEK